MQPIFIRIIFSNSFSRLQEVLNLRFIQVRVTVIHHLIQQFTAFPYAHFHSVQLWIFFPHLLHLHALFKFPHQTNLPIHLVVWYICLGLLAYKVVCLVNMLLLVEFLHALLPFTFCIVIPKGVAKWIDLWCQKSFSWQRFWHRESTVQHQFLTFIHMILAVWLKHC